MYPGGDLSNTVGISTAGAAADPQRDAERDLRADSRADPRMVAALAPFGFDHAQEPPPVSASSPHEDLLAYVAGVEEGFGAVFGALFAGLPPVGGVTPPSLVPTTTRSRCSSIAQRLRTDRQRRFHASSISTAAAG
jgi:hypothetical protein